VALVSFLGQLDAPYTLIFDKLFFRVAAILGFQCFFYAHNILQASIQYVVCNKLNLIEVKQYEGSFHALY
jgi:hypothetical protein